MKFFRLFLFVLAGILFFGYHNLYSQFEWSDEIFISQGNTPDLVIDPETGNLHMIAMTNSGVKYIVADRNGNVIQQARIRVN